MQCDPASTKTSVNSVFRWIFICVVFVPMGIIIITNLIILYIAGKFNHHGSSTKAVVTISMVCWTFVLSYAPLLVYYSIALSGYGLPGWFGIVSSYTVSINNIVNPVIYTFTNKRFAVFMKGLVRLKSKVLANRGIVTSNSDYPRTLQVNLSKDIIIENPNSIQLRQNSVGSTSVIVNEC